MDLQLIRKYVARASIGVALSAALVGLLGVWLVHDRPSLDSVDWPRVDLAAPDPDSVTMTWLGVATLLFDDGETQILIDGFVSRPGVMDIVMRRRVGNDIPLINEVLLDYDTQRLAAIIPAHSHYDHAMDIGAIANRSDASIVGSESTANIARGAGVPSDQLVITETGQVHEFGEFRISLIEVPHAPVGWRGATPGAGTIDEPLQVPARVGDWREGGSYAIVLEHPQGTAIVQGSAGFNERAFENVRADVVLLGVMQLRSLGRSYAERYWQAIVTRTGARRVLPIHFDDFTAPFGDIRLPPRIIDDFTETSRWLTEFRRTWDQDVSLILPAFGEPMAIYAVEPSPSS